MEIVFGWLHRFASLAAVVMAVMLSVVFIVWPEPDLSDLLGLKASRLATGLILNLIPLLIVFAGSYFLFGKVQQLRELAQREAMLSDLTTAAESAIGGRLDGLASKFDVAASATEEVLDARFDEVRAMVESTADLVRDWNVKGVERVYEPDEMGRASLAALEGTQTLRILGIGNSWLLKGRHYKALTDLLSKENSAVTVLMPDPFAEAIVQRYEEDESDNKELNLKKIGGRILEWVDIREEFPVLTIRTYSRYPMMHVAIYDRRVFASPALYKARLIEGLTFSFRKHSPGAELYEEHFNRVFTSGSSEIDADYIAKVRSYLAQ